jgi:hypothetical protein
MAASELKFDAVNVIVTWVMFLKVRDMEPQPTCVTASTPFP